MRLLLALALSVLATAATAQGFRFDSVSVEGNARIEDATILSIAGIPRGVALTGGQVNDASQALREAGLFRSVDLIPQGSRLVIRVVENPVVGRISIEGNRRLEDAELRAVVGSTERRVLTTAQAERDVAAMSALYAERGRINATILPRVIDRGAGVVDLVFEVTEGAVTEVGSIGFVGNRAFSDRRLRGVLETKQAGIFRQLIQRDTFVAERVEFDQQILTDFYRSRGYADFTVNSVDVSLARGRDTFLITFDVTEGQQFRIGDVGVSSEIGEIGTDLYSRSVRARPGQVYSPTLIENDIARLETLAIRQGLPFVAVDPRITRDDRGLMLNVEYVLTRGPRVFVERIDIEGNATTLDRVVRTQFDSVEGDPFNPRQIRRSAERIRALGFFSDVDVETREGTGPDQVIVDVDVTEQPTGNLTFGANFNSDVGISLLASFGERNFLGRGQSFSVQVSTARTNRILDIDFSEPNLLGRDVAGGIGLSYVRTDNENARYDTERLQLRPSLTFPVSENGRLRVYYDFDYTDISDVTTGGDVLAQEAAEGAVTRNGVGYQYSWDSRRAGIEGPTAYVLRFGQEFAVGDGSDYIQTTALAAVETRLLGEDLTLRATVEGGVLSFGDGQSRVTDRFFLTSGRMRGFAANGVGPRECDAGCAGVSDALGGDKFAVARLEAEFPLGLPEEYGITGGAFVDYGSVWDTGRVSATNTILYDDFTPRTVAGVSLFWTTPIGPLRFNFSEAVDAQRFDEVKNFDVTISTSF
ncbi:MAG: outer membrane protein assembly factor BamA [Paracoccaceae bacterium]